MQYKYGEDLFKINIYYNSCIKYYNKCNKNLGTLESKWEYNCVTAKMELRRPDLFEVLRLLWK